MDVQTIWLLVLSLATPIAGVIGFAIQLRQVKKARLENEKLQLEIAALRVAATRQEQRITPATMDEIIRYSRSTSSPHHLDIPTRVYPTFLVRLTEAVFSLAAWSQGLARLLFFVLAILVGLGVNSSYELIRTWVLQWFR